MHTRDVALRAFLALLVPAVPASPLAALAGSVRCGMTEPAVEEILLFAPPGSKRAPDTHCACLPAGNGGDVPIHFHVIHSGGNGDIPQSMVEAQVAVLNDAFMPLGISFSLASTDRTDNLAWYAATPDSIPDLAMRNALAITPQSALNIYSLSPGDDSLGWATYPWHFAETDTRHGVVIDHASMPGGSAESHDEGDTAVHETGHYLGLFHTYQGGCTPPGDLVDDTPAESDPALGCPLGSDSCAGGGPDPIENFMDASDDACRTRFTPGQAQRWYSMLHEFRPGLALAPVDPNQCLFADGFESEDVSCWQ